MTSSNSHKGKATANTNRTRFFVVVSVSLFLLLSKLVGLAYKNSPSLRLCEEVDRLIESSGGNLEKCRPSFSTVVRHPRDISSFTGGK